MDRGLGVGRGQPRACLDPGHPASRTKEINSGRLGRLVSGALFWRLRRLMYLACEEGEVTLASPRGHSFFSSPRRAMGFG